MKKYLGLFLFAMAVLVMAIPAQAQQVVWQGFIPGDGRRVGPINLQAGARYYVQAAGSMYFGRWSGNGRPLNNDACFEFTARPRPVPLPILKNNLGINYCAGYNINHVYRSAPFRSNGQALYFRIFDTDYRDNRGGINVTVFKVTGSGSGSGVLRLSCTQRHHQEGKCCCFTGAHTYRFQQRFVTNVTATFDTGKGLNCRSTVRFEVRKQGRWQTLRTINAVSGRGGTDRNRMRVTVNVQGRISGFRIADDCRCCIDYSDIVVHYTGGGGSGGGGGGTQARCRNYANRAVQQNKSNLSRGCGYTGNRWQSNFNNHFNWCRGASSSAARNEDQIRVNKLAQCGGGTQARCRQYAQRAVQQNKSNLSRGCGYTGNRWQSNYNNHFNWCRGVSSSAARNEDQARVNQLARCGGGSPPGSVVRFNNPRSHGLPWDWCLTWATNCGKPAADDFCRKKGYRHSVRWGKRTFSSTWVVNSNRRCDGSCGGFTFVECAR